MPRSYTIKPLQRYDTPSRTIRFLRNHSIDDRQIPIRSSLFRLLRNCPRAFLHRARHGLIDKSGRPEALQMGDYFHVGVEALLNGLTADKLSQFLAAQWKTRVDSWVSEANTLNMDPPTQQDFDIQREKYRRAVNWAVTAWSVMPLNLQKYRVVGTELPIRLSVPGIGSPIVIRMDALLVDTDTNDIYIFDAKSTSHTPHVRMLAAPLDFQSRLYPYVVQRVLETGGLQQLGIAPKARLRGFIHWVLQKPNIRYLKTTEKNSGPQAAANELLARDRDWLLAQGEFHHLSVERTNNTQPIQMSMIPFDPHLMKDEGFMVQLRELDLACRRPGYPPMFPPIGDNLIPDYPGASIDPLLPLYEAHDNYAAWPRIIAENFAIQYRDDREPEPSLDIRWSA